MTAIYDYYDDEWRTKNFQCPKCNWSGTQNEMDGPNIFKELVDYCCGHCEEMLLIVSHPFLSQTYEAAAAGNEHALYELGVMSGEGKYYDEFKREIEKANQVLRDSWEKFDGPKMLFMGSRQTLH